MTHDLQMPQAIREALEAGALFVASHSGGKDSQAMTALLRRVVPADRLVVVHADLPGVDWAGTFEHIERTIGGLELHVCQANYRDGSPGRASGYSGIPGPPRQVPTTRRKS